MLTEYQHRGTLHLHCSLWLQGESYPHILIYPNHSPSSHSISVGILSTTRLLWQSRPISVSLFHWIWYSSPPRHLQLPCAHTQHRVDMILQLSLLATTNITATPFFTLYLDILLLPL
jgi:hypothetical protein